MTEETKVKAATEDMAILSLEEGQTPWTRLQREVEGVECESDKTWIRDYFAASKRLVLELLRALESRQCPHVPRVIRHQTEFFYPQWDNLDDRRSMGVELWDDRRGVHVAADGHVISEYEWPGGSMDLAAEIVLRYLHLVFPVDPPGWDRLRREANIHSAHANCPKSVRDYFEKTKEAVVAMLCELQARGCPWLPEIASGYYDGIGLIWKNGKRNQVLYGLWNGRHQVDGVVDSHETNDGYKAVDLVLEHLKILFVADKKSKE